MEHNRCVFFIEQQYMKNVFIIDGIDNLDYNQLVQKLTQELEKSESTDSFIIAIKKCRKNLIRS